MVAPFRLAVIIGSFLYHSVFQSTSSIAVINARITLLVGLEFTSKITSKLTQLGKIK